MWIKPSNVNTACKSSMSVQHAIGIFPTIIGGEIHKIKVYYSPNATGTIIGPMAITRQNPHKYCGIRKDCYIDSNDGELMFFDRDDHPDVHLPLYGDNDLWWHVIQGNPERPVASEKGITFSISTLSDAAKWELWHQQTGHSGRTVLESLYKHADGVPKLHGNVFYKCPSCMSGKATKQPIHMQQQPWKHAIVIYCTRH